MCVRGIRSGFLFVSSTFPLESCWNCAKQENAHSAKVNLCYCIMSKWQVTIDLWPDAVKFGILSSSNLFVETRRNHIYRGWVWLRARGMYSAVLQLHTVFKHLLQTIDWHQKRCLKIFSDVINPVVCRVIFSQTSNYFWNKLSRPLLVNGFTFRFGKSTSVFLHSLWQWVTAGPPIKPGIFNKVWYTHRVMITYRSLMHVSYKKWVRYSFPREHVDGMQNLTPHPWYHNR